MTKLEIRKLTERYIGTSGGYLGTFKSHTDLSNFYMDCDLDIDPRDYEGTNAKRFVKILEISPPKIQATIVRGILKRHPVIGIGQRTINLFNEFLEILNRLEEM